MAEGCIQARRWARVAAGVRRACGTRVAQAAEPRPEGSPDGPFALSLPAPGPACSQALGGQKALVLPNLPFCTFYTLDQILELKDLQVEPPPSHWTT